MSVTLELETSARQWLDDEVHRRGVGAGVSADKDLPRLQLSPVSWVLPKLLRIVYQNSQQPIEVMAPLIRSMLQEQAFANTGGDPCDCERLNESIDESVSILCLVLERARQHCLAHPA